MIEAKADVALGEAIRPAVEAHRHVYKGGFVPIILASLIFATVSVVGMILAAVVTPVLGQWSGIASMLGFVVGAMLAIGFYSRVHLRGFLKGLRRLGSPDSFPTRFRFDETGIEVDTDRVSHRVPWTAVQLFLPAAQHWLVQADTTTLAIPRRAFTTAQDEQAFVELAKNSLSEPARQSSLFEINSGKREVARDDFVIRQRRSAELE